MRCEQKKCGFLNSNFCPDCKGCGSPSNIIDNNCVDCWVCTHDEGIVRGKVNFDKLKDDQKNKIQEIEIVAR